MKDGAINKVFDLHGVFMMPVGLVDTYSFDIIIPAREAVLKSITWNYELIEIVTGNRIPLDINTQQIVALTLAPAIGANLGDQFQALGFLGANGVVIAADTGLVNKANIIITPFL